MTDCKSCHQLSSHFLKQLIHSKYEYREVNESNNNLKYPSYCQTGQPFLRFSKPDYADGLNEPAGNDRPSARELSNLVFNQEKEQPNSDGLSNIFWLWGQFVDHSITLTDVGETPFPILVPKGDKFFDPNGTGTATISLTRSLYDPKTGKEGIPRQQINQLSPLLDASMVYGHDQERNDYLRLFKEGLMRTSQGEMLPFFTGGFPNAGNSKYGSFIAGDVRCNEHIGLASMHNLFILEHNHWAKEIKYLVPELTDQEIYQTARMIIEAEIQSITYNEFLPILLGKEALSKYKGYNPEVNPQLNNEFATAAYRFGHSMVASNMYGNERKLKDTFFSSHIICNNGGMSPIIKQFCTTRAETLNSKIIGDLRNFLFGPPGHGGHDLAALNIQRGRDHGLASYNQVRKDLGLSVHAKRQNMDLFVGGLLECPYQNALVGETFYHLIKDQFERIRDGDRFWYQKRMNQKQIEYINGITLGQIIYRHAGLDLNDVFHISSPGCKCNH